MHQPRTPRTARAMRLGAGTLFLVVCSFLATIGIIGYGLYLDDRNRILAGLGVLALTFFLFIVHRIFASGAKCPLCRCPVLSKSGASRNRNARKWLGSYRMRVARDIVLKNSFTCPYCNESTRCTAKHRPPQHQTDDRQRRRASTSRR